MIDNELNWILSSPSSRGSHIGDFSICMECACNEEPSVNILPQVVYAFVVKDGRAMYQTIYIFRGIPSTRIQFRRR